MTPLLGCTIFLSEKAEGLVLVALLCHPVHFLRSQRRDKMRIGAFSYQRPRHHFLFVFLPPNPHSCLQIYFYPSIFPVMPSPSFSASLPLFFHLAPGLSCQFSHVEPCLSYLLPMYSLHSDLLQYGQQRPPGPQCTGIP